MPTTAALTLPKYRQVHDALRQQIVSGRWPVGARLPSEADLVEQFGASRITVGRAVRDLQRAGLVERRVGSGTYVRAPVAGRSPVTLGLLVPDADEAAIFGPILEALMTAPQERPVLFARCGDVQPAAPSRAEAAWTAARHLLQRRVGGVFFAPLEGLLPHDLTNQRIVQAFDAARVPVVLLDRAVYPYPHRGPYDLVGIDNRRAGYTAAAHLLEVGARRVAFLSHPRPASSVVGRRAGWREALLGVDPAWDPRLDVTLDAVDGLAMRHVLDTVAPDAFVCANDRLAAMVLQTLHTLGVRVPADIRLVGFDDADFAALLPVPLTTLRQPVREIGQAAAAAMAERLTHPALPARDIFLQTTLVVRASSGG
jgi:GntR family transcriptional regulator, arabinose operon transcriptional repressor